MLGMTIDKIPVSDITKEGASKATLVQGREEYQLDWGYGIGHTFIWRRPLAHVEL